MKGSPDPTTAIAPAWRRFVLGFRLATHHGARLLLTRRKLAIALIAFLLVLGAEIAMFTADDGRHASADVFLVYCGFMILNLVLPFLSLITSLGLLGGEIEKGTLVYLLTRPCPRLAILLGRITAAAFVTGAAVAALVGLGLVVARACVSADVGIGWELAFNLILVGAAGSVVFSALYTALVLCFRRPVVALALGATHALVWEGIVAALPGRVGAYTLTQNLRSLFFEHPDVGAWARRFLFRDAQAAPSTEDAIVFLAGVGLAAIALAWHRFSGREL